MFRLNAKKKKEKSRTKKSEIKKVCGSFTFMKQITGFGPLLNLKIKWKFVKSKRSYVNFTFVRRNYANIIQMLSTKKQKEIK
jgi:hypothetical protein